MQPAETPSPLSTPKVLDPLWIIPLFLGLSETTTGVAAILSTGWFQGFSRSCCRFPLLVSFSPVSPMDLRVRLVMLAVRELYS